MAKTLKVLCFHGLGDQRSSHWDKAWRESLTPLLGADDGIAIDWAFPSYDPIFESTQISLGDTLSAFWKLARSGLSHLTRRERGLFGTVSERLRWTAGYVVAWVEDKAFQQRTREFVLEQVREHQPDLILAHSLGSLITYNALTHADAREPAIAKALARAHYVTFGSQIGNPFVIGNLTFGRVQQPAVRFWHHLYNVEDDVFTAPLNIPGVDSFRQLLTPFDLPGRGDHDALGYFEHQVTVTSLWRPMVNGLVGGKGLGSPPAWLATAPGAARKGSRVGAKAVRTPERAPQRKALLVGINDYPNEADRLEGCVNDVFTMSAVLQDLGFRPDEIRTCLDSRATAAGILERLQWLLENARGGDELVFYYSGHGARVPEYGERMEPDRLTETLVPHDFDWSPERSVSDEQIYALYSQLPYDVRLIMIFDCCHSGGLHRHGGAKARGITPPDDIRHRQLRWDSAEEMWVERDFLPINPAFASTDAELTRSFFGKDRATVRLGRAGLLRVADEAEYDAAAAAATEPIGPFLPLIIQACAEDQLSYEYRHGATSYGAFTFCLASLLRREKNLTFAGLVRMTREQLARLDYRQTPVILGPKALQDAPIPFRTGIKAAPAKGGRGRAGRGSALPGGETPPLSG